MFAFRICLLSVTLSASVFVFDLQAGLAQQPTTVNSLDREIGILNDKVKQIDDRRAHHGQDIKTLQGQVERLNTDVQDLKKTLGGVSRDDLEFVKYLKIIAWLVGVLTVAIVGELIRKFMNKGGQI